MIGGKRQKEKQSKGSVPSPLKHKKAAVAKAEWCLKQTNLSMWESLCWIRLAS